MPSWALCAILGMLTVKISVASIRNKLPRLALRNRISDFKGKVPEISRKFLGIRYVKILFDNFAILVGVIRRHATPAESAVAPRLFTAFIHGLKSRGILRRRINKPYGLSS